MRIIDVNAGAGFWPIQHFTITDLETLDTAYEAEGIDEVWISAVESILFPEPDTHDFRLFEKLISYRRFRPVKTLNLNLANWRKSCDLAIGSFPIAAFKLFPNYHDFALDSTPVGEACAYAAECSVPVLLQMRVNDERNQPSFLEVGGVSPYDIAALSQRHPKTRFIALCPYIYELDALSHGGSNLMADIAFLDFAETLTTSTEWMPADRLVFGSHAPFLHIKSSVLKVERSALPEADRLGVASHNLKHILQLRTTGKKSQL